MRTRLLPVPAAYCLAFAVLQLASRISSAEVVRYPATEPVIQVTLPDAWMVTVQDGPAHLLLCSPPNDPTYTISVMTLPTVGGKEDLKAILTRIVRAGAEGAGMSNVTVSAAKEDHAGDNARAFTTVTASGKNNGEICAYTFHAFSMPGTGKCYAIGVAGLQTMIDAHKAEFAAAASSIQLVR